MYLLLLLVPGHGALAAPIQRLSFQIIGVGAWVIGLGSAIAGVKIFDGRSWKKGLLTLGGTLLTTLAFLALVGLVSAASAGMVGRLLSRFASDLLGQAAAAGFLLMFVLLGLVMTSGLRLSALIRAVGRGAGRTVASAYGWAFAPTEEPLQEIDVTGTSQTKMPTIAPVDLFPVAEPHTEPSDSLFRALSSKLAPKEHLQNEDHHELADDDEQVETDPFDPEAERVWKLPPVSLLDKLETPKGKGFNESNITAIGRTIVESLQSFGIETTIVGISSGPTVTQFEIRPAPGVSVKKILNHQTDLSLALAAPVRIQPFLIGKSAISIEVPHQATHVVSLREIATSTAFTASKSILRVVLGSDVSGEAVVGDLTEMPHLLVAGATGSGKSVLITSLLSGFILQANPDQLRLILIDPKRVELSAFADLPHLLVPVVVEPDAAVAALRWAVKEMEDRYKLLASHGMRNIARFNEEAPGLGIEPLPYVVIVIDELADLMMVAAGEIEDLVCRLAQLARAVGIHLVVATQRPSTDIITGLIKANIPSRIAFAVSSGIDSRVILDEPGAEKLLGRGDMLYLPIGEGRPRRLQGAYVSDRERDEVVSYWKRQGPPSYESVVFEVGAALSIEKEAKKRDPYFGKAAHIVASEGRAAASLLQRKLGVGYARAARIIDQLAEYHVVGAYEGSKSRSVLMDPYQVDELLDQLTVDAAED